MTFEAENIAIENRFYTSWGTATPIKFDNVDFTPPAATAYVELQVHDSDSYPASLGGTILYRNLGIISINIYALPNQGAKANRQYADTAAAVFRGQTFSGITCRAASITRLGEIKDRFVYNVSIPFFRDEAF